MTIGRRHNPRVFQEGAEEFRTTMTMFGVSALLHGVVFLILVSMPGFGSSRSLAGRSITVSLVSLPEPGGGSVSLPEPVPAPEPPPKVETAPEPPVQETVSIPEPQPAAVSIAPKKAPPPELKSLKKKTKTNKRLKVKKAPVKKTSPKPKPVPKPPERSTSVTSAIAALKNRVAAEEAQGGGTGSGGGPAGVTLVDIYSADVAETIRRNWAYPQQLAGTSENLQARVIFKVLPNGEIKDIEFDKRSGNRYLDDSAEKAILKSSPVAPFPSRIRRRYLEIGLIFTPTGIR